MKKAVLLLLCAAATLLAVSCTKTSGGSDTIGVYGLTADVELSSSEAPEFWAMKDALVNAFKGESVIYRTTANDNKAIAACDKVYEAHKSSAGKTATFTLYFQEANVLGEAEKAKQTVKQYKFVAAK